jgi:hypothetical protein
MEISPVYYRSIESFVCEEPDLKELVKKCMKDNKITMEEYREIRDQYLKSSDKKSLDFRKKSLIKLISTQE